MNKTVKNYASFVLFESHVDCNCSYCKGKNKLHYGLNIPTDWKSWNSWWVIKYSKTKYIRWTNNWLKLKR